MPSYSSAEAVSYTHLFLGSGFALIIYLYSLGLSPYQLISSSYLTIEVVSSISSSIGVILSVPLTALISSVILTRGKGLSLIHIW